MAYAILSSRVFGCDDCGVRENVDLLCRAKDLDSGVPIDKALCIRCGGEAWMPFSAAALARSVAPELGPLYTRYGLQLEMSARLDAFAKRGERP